MHYGRTGSLECKPCKSKAAILSAYIISTVLVLCFLAFLIQLSKQENEDEAAGMPDVGRTSELVKVRLPRFFTFTLLELSLGLDWSL